MKPAETHLNLAAENFHFGAPIARLARYGDGHINDTFCLETAANTRFILQRMSPVAFSRHDLLMENLSAVTSFLAASIKKAGGDPAREAMSILPTKSGASYFTDPDGIGWRVYPFITDSMCLLSADNADFFAESGYAFGKFQRLLADFPAHTLHETIPNFHNTPVRLENLWAAVKEDKVGRACLVEKELSFVRARADDCRVATDALTAGKLPLRVTHNDTKLNNVLFDAKTGKSLCVIDLDTVMPGLSIYDFGDSIRFGANHCLEDEPDYTKMSLDLSLFHAYTHAFIRGTEGILTQEELSFLPWGAKLMTLECGIRFLTDFLQGDVYFKTHRDNQNLDRCRTQFMLVHDIEQKWTQMHACVQEIAAQLSTEAAQ